MTRTKKTGSVLLTALVGMMVITSACSDNKNNNQGNAAEQTPAAGNNATGTNDAPPADPMAKYDPPIELTTVAFEGEKPEYPAGDSIDNNIWTRAYASDLGINVKNLWVAANTPEVRDQKMSVTIASGNLPDVMHVTAREMQMLIESGQVEDLTDVYDQYASEGVKNIMSYNGGIILDAASYKGKLMALPDTTQGGGTDGAPMIWVRTDWLDKLKLSPPKTMDDVMKIATAFTNDDPDGNGKKDTFGMALDKNIYDGFAGVQGFFSAYHAYPFNVNVSMWQKDEATGKLAYSGIQPQVKNGLIALNQMFKQGLIDPEFPVKDGNKVAETVTSGKVGLMFGQFWNASWPLNDLKKADNKSEWMPYPLVSADDQPAKSYVETPVPSMYYVVKKGYDHKEAVVKMLNYYYDKIYGEHAESDKFHTVTENGKKIQVFGSATIQTFTMDTNVKAHELVTEALKTGDTSKLNDEFLGYYTQMKEATAGTNLTGWYLNPIFGENGAYEVLKNYNANNLILSNEFYGSPTPTMIEKGAFLKQQEIEAFTKIIMGAAPADDFDKFVENWKQLGGDKITEEVNEWYATKSK
ncbi:extracellular solute-binding protein [Paenibacillus sacheonensis]|uniref:Extracellular solute-binding protein n=1 Tax=Paenibacillus sacheonensis TaxID=742054 RepID=A0A7X4YNN2_9BACL|nr:extracellular solute-binding protein [Paenibacillus sacheonensis]NBC69710.1 extracellular solute-binding protein [Paenibacillus sacheonensis]